MGNKKTPESIASELGYIYECTEDAHLVQNLKNLLKQFNPIDVESEGKYVVKLENETSEFTSEACDSLLNAYKEAFKWYGEYLQEKDKKLKAEMHSRLVWTKMNDLDFYIEINARKIKNKMIRKIFMECFYNKNKNIGLCFIEF